MKNVIANPLCKSTLRNHISSHFFLKAFEVELEAIKNTFSTTPSRLFFVVGNANLSRDSRILIILVSKPLSNEFFVFIFVKRP